MNRIFSKGGDQRVQQPDMVAVLESCEDFFSRYFSDDVCRVLNPGWCVEIERQGVVPETEEQDSEVWRLIKFLKLEQPLAVGRFSVEKKDMLGTVAFDNWRSVSSKDMSLILAGCSCFFGAGALANIQSTYSRFQQSWVETLWDFKIGTGVSQAPNFSLIVSRDEYREIPESEWKFHI